MVIYNWNPRTWGTQARGSQFDSLGCALSSRLGLYNETPLWRDRDGVERMNKRDCQEIWENKMIKWEYMN